MFYIWNCSVSIFNFREQHGGEWQVELPSERRDQEQRPGWRGRRGVQLRRHQAGLPGAGAAGAGSGQGLGLWGLQKGGVSTCSKDGSGVAEQRWVTLFCRRSGWWRSAWPLCSQSLCPCSLLSPLMPEPPSRENGVWGVSTVCLVQRLTPLVCL